MASSRTRLAFSLDEPLVGGDLLQGHGAAGMELLGADAYLGAEAKLGAVGEGGGGVVVDAGGIDPTGEAGGRFGVVGDDALAMARAVAGDVADGLVGACHAPDGHLVVEELGAIALGGGGLEQGVGIVTLQCLKGIGIGIDGDLMGGQALAELREVGQTVAMDEEAIEGVADADAASLGRVVGRVVGGARAGRAGGRKEV